MKKILALAFVLIAVGYVNANGMEQKSPTGMSVINSGSVIKLFYRGEQTGKVKVTILNEKGGIVFMETMQHIDNFMRPYNFSALPYGEYTIRIDDAQGRRSHSFKYGLETEKRVAHLTRLDGTAKKYMLAVPNDGHETLTVRIYGDSHKLLYQEKNIVNGDFAQVYNLDDVGGQYTFEIVDAKGKSNRLAK